MKYSYTFATLALAASAVTVYAAPLGESEALHARSNTGGAVVDHILAARLVNVNKDKDSHDKNQTSNSNGTYEGDTVNPNTTSGSTAIQSTNQNGDGNNFGGTGYGGNGGGASSGGGTAKCGGSKRGLASRRAFARRNGPQGKSSGDDGSDDDGSDYVSDTTNNNTSSSKTNSGNSDSGNTSYDDHEVINNNNSNNDNSITYNGNGSNGGSTPQSVTGSNGGANENNCVIMRRALVAQERRDEASGLAVLRSLGAMTEREVEDPLEALAARDVGYSARMLGVEGHGHDHAGGAAARRSSFIFDDGLARRDASGLAVRCAQGYEGCSVAMRREAAEMLREHARDLGFHF